MEQTGRIDDGNGVPALDLSILTARQGERARAAFAARDAARFLLATCDWTQWLHLVWINIRPLRVAGLYEEALLLALTKIDGNNASWAPNVLRLMLDLADRERLLASGDPLPGPGPFTLYRGVAGGGRARRIRGISWTRSFERAKWFAKWFERADPAVFTVTVERSAVLAYTNARTEDEFIVILPADARPRRVWDLRAQ